MTKLFTVAKQYQEHLRKNGLGYGESPRFGDPRSEWEQYLQLLRRTALNALNWIYKEKYTDLEEHGIKLEMRKYSNTDDYYYVLSTSSLVNKALEFVGLGEVKRRAYNALKPWIVGDVKVFVE